MRTLVAPLVLLAVPLAHATPPGDPPPRVIARVDATLLFPPNASAEGGGGISVPVGGTGAGLAEGYGAEIGVELRVHRWFGLEAAAGRCGSTLEVARQRGFDFRSASADLETLRLGLVLTPPKWRFKRGRMAIGVLLVRAEIPNASSNLDVAVDDSETGFGVDVRGDLFLSEKRRWGVGAGLALVDLDARFVDLETDAAGSLQGLDSFLRVGARGAW